MARIVISNPKRFSAVFNEMELKPYSPITAYTVEHNKRLFVNWTLPLLQWETHGTRCVDDILEMLRLVGNWQGRLQGRQPRFNAHAAKPTILRNNSLRDQKIRFPVFPKQSAPYVQWVHDENNNGWLIHGFTFNDDLPSVGAYFSAITALKDAYLEMIK